MNVIETEFKGLYLLEPNVFPDERGYFYESYNNLKFIENNLHHVFVQDNESLSAKGVVRGFHYQIPPHAQSKLVRVVRGSVQDVVIDMRSDSESFGKSYSIILSAENKKQLLIPRGFAHGFLSLEDDTILAYKCDNYYKKESERGIHVFDQSIFSSWEMTKKEMIISEKDDALTSFDDAVRF